MGKIELGSLSEELNEGVEAFQELKVSCLSIDAIGVGRYFLEVAVPLIHD